MQEEKRKALYIAGGVAVLLGLASTLYYLSRDDGKVTVDDKDLSQADKELIEKV